MKQADRYYNLIKENFPGVFGECQEYSAKLGKLYNLLDKTLLGMDLDGKKDTAVYRMMRHNTLVPKEIKKSREAIKAERELGVLETLIYAKEFGEVSDFEGIKKKGAYLMTEEATGCYKSLEKTLNSATSVFGMIDDVQRERVITLAAGVILYAQEALDLGGSRMDRQTRIKNYYMKAHAYWILGDNNKTFSMYENIAEEAKKVKGYSKLREETFDMVIEASDMLRLKELHDEWKKQQNKFLEKKGQ